MRKHCQQNKRSSIFPVVCNLSAELTFDLKGITARDISELPIYPGRFYLSQSVCKSVFSFFSTFSSIPIRAKNRQTHERIGKRCGYRQSKVRIFHIRYKKSSAVSFEAVRPSFLALHSFLPVNP